ncbi:MAG: PQQ-binding-like beta-propeller repeat protein [Dehalococcoidia bacterium]
MASEAGPDRVPMRIVCRVCGAVNGAERRYCSSCWSRLERGRLLTEREEVAYVIRRRRLDLLRRYRRWVLLVSVAAVLSILGYRYFKAPSPLPPAATAVTSLSTPGSWSMEGYNPQHTRYAPGPAPTFQGRLKWTFTTSEPFLASPVVAGDAVYIATADNRIVALDAATGAVRWQVATTGPVDSTPAVAGDTLYVGLRDGTILALAAATGQQRWVLKTGGPAHAPPVVVNGEVYVGAGDKRIYALDAATGKLRWRGKVGDWVSQAVSVADNILVAAVGGAIYYFDTRTGEKIFDYRVGLTVAGAPAVNGSVVYASDRTFGVRAIDLQARQGFWEKPLRRVWGQLDIWGMAPSLPPPTGFMWAFIADGGVGSAIAVTDDALYFGTGSGQVVALDPQTQRPLWTFQTGARVDSSPAIVGDTLYVGSFDGFIYALDASTGELRWRFATGGPIHTNPAVSRWGVFVTGDDGVLYAIE